MTKETASVEIISIKEEDLRIPQSLEDLRITFEKNTKFLSRELALNYFNCSMPSEEKSWNGLGILDQKRVKDCHGKSALTMNYDITKLPSDRKDLLAKNVLIIGAGASFDMYKDIPLGQQAINLIYNSYIVGEIALKDKKPFELSLGYLADLFVYDSNDADKKTQRESKCKDLKITIDEEVDKLIMNADPNNGEDQLFFYKCLGEKYARNYNKIKYRAGLTEQGGKKIDFEQALYLLSQMFTGDIVRKDLELLYDKRYGHSFFYSLVAVLFRQRAIDVIINFNFDELLDQAIEDELGEGRYNRIVNEGDCLTFDDYCEEVKIQGKYYQKLISPLYVKPHGTFSDKKSMRFTKDHYDDIPTSIEDLLIDLFNDYSNTNLRTKPGYAEITDRGDVLKNIFLVGFAMGSLELDRILRRSKPKRLNLFPFVVISGDYKQPIRDACLNYWNILGHNYPAQTANFLGIYPIPLGLPRHEDESGLLYPDNDILSPLFNLIYSEYRNMFHDPFKPVKTPKQRINHLIFNDPSFLEGVNSNNAYKSDRFYKKDKNRIWGLTPKNRYPESYFDSSKYFKDKTLLELLIKFHRAEGGIVPYKGLDYLVGKYLMLYVKSTKSKNRLTFMKMVRTALDPGSKLQPFDGFFVKNFNGFRSLTTQSKYLGLFSNEFREFVIQKLDDIDWVSAISSEFTDITSELSTMIKSYHSGSKYHFFAEFERKDILFSHLGIDYHYSNQLTKKEVDTICIISERGKRFSRFSKLISKGKIKNIYIILNAQRDEHAKDKEKRKALYEDLTTNFTKNFADTLVGINVEILFLPVGRHNHHLTLFLGENPFEKDLEDITHKDNLGIYYYQQGYNSIVSPIRVKVKQNIQSLIWKFKAEWGKAKSYKDSGAL